MFVNATVLDLYAKARMSEAAQAERAHVLHREMEQAQVPQARPGRWHFLRHMVVIPHKHAQVGINS